jgi:hypothetical protein
MLDHAIRAKAFLGGGEDGALGWVGSAGTAGRAAAQTVNDLAHGIYSGQAEIFDQ